jgi:Ca2+-binding RTX toxin-like protein
VIGTEAADLLQGQAGQAATMTGLGGDDTYRIAHDATQIVELVGAGTDTLVVTAAAGSYLLNAGAEVELLRAEAGSAPINIGGNGFSQRIEGNDGANILSSGGGGGVDTMAGGLGDDTYRVFATGDVIDDTGGFDTVYASGTSYFLYSTAAVEYLSTSEQAATTPIYLVGNGAAQVIAGNWGDNILNGRGGDGVALPDTLIGLYGNDTYGVFSQGDVVREVAGQGNDVVYASTSYQLRAGTEIEALAAVNGAATDAYTLTGNEIAQTVVGNAGANVLDGRGGSDTLIGLGGADTFAFTSVLGTGNVDTVQDFGAEDRIGLASDLFSAVTNGGIEAGELVLGTAAQDADDRLLYDQATGRLFYDADANGAGAAVLFAQFSPGTALTAASFTTLAPVSDLPGA